jgi:hypothetical protein
VPQPGEWSVGKAVNHLILSEQVLRRDMAIFIEWAKAGQTPYLYRSFAEFNARPAFIPECALLFLEAPPQLLEYVYTGLGYKNARRGTV